MDRWVHGIDDAPLFCTVPGFNVPRHRAVNNLDNIYTLYTCPPGQQFGSSCYNPRALIVLLCVKY